MNPISTSDFCVNSKNSWDEIRRKMDCESYFNVLSGNRESERFGKKEKEIALDASRHITRIIFQERKESLLDIKFLLIADNKEIIIIKRAESSTRKKVKERPNHPVSKSP